MHRKLQEIITFDEDQSSLAGNLSSLMNALKCETVLRAERALQSNKNEVNTYFFYFMAFAVCIQFIRPNAASARPLTL